MHRFTGASFPARFLLSPSLHNRTQLRKPRPVPAFNPALGFAKPPLPYPASPTRTEHSAALWELLDTASLAGQSLAGSYIGPVPGSPAAAAEREHRRT